MCPLGSSHVSLKFQLTPPIRVATLSGAGYGVSGLVISTHATHKGGDALNSYLLTLGSIISTHATHKGGDIKRKRFKFSNDHFNSRHP